MPIYGYRHSLMRARSCANQIDRNRAMRDGNLNVTIIWCAESRVRPFNPNIPIRMTSLDLELCRFSTLCGADARAGIGDPHMDTMLDGCNQGVLLCLIAQVL